MIPKFFDLALPILKICKDGKEYHMKELVSILSDQFKLTEEERNLLIPSGKITVILNRTQWVVFELKSADFVKRENRIVSITNEGLKILKKNPPNIDKKFLRENSEKYQEYEKRIEKRKKNKLDDESTDKGTTQSPEDVIRTHNNTLKEIIKDELLEKIKSNKPDFFEYVVQDLLRSMGYGVNSEVIGKPGDGGIDGIIKEDKLGIEEIYFQAKRYEGTIPIKQIREFAGALSYKKSKKGIFITTSNFPKDAYDFVKTVDSRIILIDGDQLAEFMFIYNVGVKIQETYHIKEIDMDYFQ